MKVMVVDDDNTTRKILDLYLKGLGYETVFAENGLDALEKLATNEVNIILTDLNMPYMDGIELTKTIKKDPILQKIPIIMITTKQSEEEKINALKTGADLCLIKPLTAETVAENIKNLLSEKSI
ncbi:Chemotaxis protein CheY [Candidatus Magnetoovum chiemensis]|nr:Chemotaxis protein CheY [Candidatus Magnetoovum chiemensis]